MHTIIIEENSNTKKNKKKQKNSNLRRDYINGYLRLISDYFGPNPVYTAKLFNRRFRIPKVMFSWIMNEIVAYDSY